jgi:type II secretory pathway pseudopilin PulG
MERLDGATRRGETRRAGATLVEVTVSTALVATVLVAALETLGAASRSHTMATNETDAVNLAECMLAEVMARDYADPEGGTGFGLDTGETRTLGRTLLDDVDDYDVLDEAPPVDRSGVPIPGYTGWTRKTRVRYVNRFRDASGDLVLRSDDQGLKRIGVEVIDPAGVSRTFVTLRSASGPGDLHPGVNTNLIRGFEVAIEAGGAARVTVGVANANEARAP